MARPTDDEGIKASRAYAVAQGGIALIQRGQWPTREMIAAGVRAAEAGGALIDTMTIRAIFFEMLDAGIEG